MKSNTFEFHPISDSAHVTSPPVARLRQAATPTSGGQEAVVSTLHEMIKTPSPSSYTMTAPSLPSLKPDSDDATRSSFWSFLGAPMAGNASFIAGFLHWLAIAFRWFLRFILLLLAVGVVLGIGALIFGSLPFHNFRRGGKLKNSTDGDAPPDADLVELEFMAADYDPDDSRTSESDDEV